MTPVEAVAKDIARRIVSGKWSDQEIKEILVAFRDAALNEAYFNNAQYRLGRAETLKEALDWVRAEARDCGCSKRIEDHLRGL